MKDDSLELDAALLAGAFDCLDTGEGAVSASDVREAMLAAAQAYHSPDDVRAALLIAREDAEQASGDMLTALLIRGEALYQRLGELGAVTEASSDDIRQLRRLAQQASR